MLEEKNSLPDNNRLGRRIKEITVLALVAQIIVFAALTATKAQSASDSPNVIIYNNGPFQTGSTSKSGVTAASLGAPTGAQFSEVQNNAGDTTASNNVGGFACSTASAIRCADNFVVPTGESWTINAVIVYGYQTGSAPTPSPFTGGTLQIWNGRPGDPGSTIVFGDTTTNRLSSSTTTNTYRIFNTVAPPPGTTPGITRQIWANTLTVSPGLVLAAGNYWIDFQLTASGAGTNFTPSVTVVDTRANPLQNARQFTNGAWTDVVDTGNPTTAGSVNQDFPFLLDGTRTNARAFPYSRTVDFNGDNRTDFAVARSASATAQTTWIIQNNGSAGISSGPQWGLGVGFPNGDVAVPADYDGDGRADVAVWRANGLGDPQRSFFFILQSGTNTVRQEQFGSSGDDPTIVGDYDGDGKADVATFRPATGSGNSFFYFRASSGAAGNINGVPFGIAGDKPYPGDFDGDGKYDFAVIRNNGGNAQHFQRRTTQGFVTTSYGLFTDRFVTADFDGDYKNDLIAVRNNGGLLTWFISTSTTNQFVGLNFGTATTDIIVPGDYDGDSKSDLAVYRSSGSGAGFYTFGAISAPRYNPFGGTSGDFPVAVYQVH
jgi:hypothetical protein